jgi:hypothetical protein
MLAQEDEVTNASANNPLQALQILRQVWKDKMMNQGSLLLLGGWLMLALGTANRIHKIIPDV